MERIQNTTGNQSKEMVSQDKRRDDKNNDAVYDEKGN